MPNVKRIFLFFALSGLLFLNSFIAEANASPEMKIEDLAQNERELAQAALKYRANAYAPYSNFAVGAAVQTSDGVIYGGANVENASYSLTICAERNAIFSAVAAGAKNLTSLAVVADAPRPVPPCGSCRQVMAEFNIKRVILLNTAGKVIITSVSELLPCSFEATDIAKN